MAPPKEVSRAFIFLGWQELRPDFLAEPLDDFDGRVLGSAVRDTRRSNSQPGKKSLTVGRSGSASERVTVVTASARSLPALTNAIDVFPPPQCRRRCCEVPLPPDAMLILPGHGPGVRDELGPAFG